MTDFQRLVEESLGKPLPIYGASLFENVPSTFAPVDRIPVTADYVIGPGDELMIRAWGQIDLDVHARVDRNGNVFLPKVGSVDVAGLKYAQIESFLKSHIGRIYQNFDLNVTMGELRSIDIYVVGQATRPGRYTVSSLSTLTNAIFASGGPSPHGSMRGIQLKRGGNVVTTFDLYDLLLKGDKSKDVVLQPEDVIYILPTGPQVAMGGQINVPAIYELKTETTLSDAVRLSGGLTNTAFGGKVYVEHIVNRRVHSVEEVPLDAAGMAHPLADGDIVNFTAVSPKFENSVTLRGNVAQPGRYPWHSGMRISDLIPNREFLITREYWQQQNAIVLESETTGGHVKGTAGTVNSVKRNAPEIDWNYAVVQRMSTEDLSTQLIPFDLGKAILGQDAASNVTLQPGDIITIFSQADLKVPEGQQTRRRCSSAAISCRLLLEGLVGFWRGSHTPSPIQGSYSLGSGPWPSGSSSSRNARRHPEESERCRRARREADEGCQLGGSSPSPGHDGGTRRSSRSGRESCPIQASLRRP